jgi:hypothetical protein
VYFSEEACINGEKAGTPICVSAYLRIRDLGDNKITKKSRKFKKESLDTVWKKMFLRVLMRICVSVIF